MKNAEKKDFLTRAISTDVLTNSVFFISWCVFKMYIFAENTRRRVVSAKNKNPKHYLKI